MKATIGTLLCWTASAKYLAVHAIWRLLYKFQIDPDSKSVNVGIQANS